MKSVVKYLVLIAAAVGIGYALSHLSKGAVGAPGTIGAIMHDRGLTEDDVTAACKTFMPTGKHDSHIMFASGGHSGQIIVVGLPSMRILKYIGVFAPEPWQGYGFDNGTRQVLKDGSPEGELLTWGDVHHPGLSETNAEYDGQFLFCNDKNSARLAVISLKDFNTVQMCRSGLLQSDHGGCFVTPNTEYVCESGQLASPLAEQYADLNDEGYKAKYRSAAIFWKFDRDKGRIDRDASFVIELPPYMQDLADSGKFASDGWMFINSFNTERSYGTGGHGKPVMESGASQNDMDYLHVINWKKGAEVAADESKITRLLGMRVITLDSAVKEGILHFIPEPKSPHGVDISPDGKSICVSGKLDTHVTVYDIDKVKSLIDQKRYAGKDDYGVPILPFEKSIRGQCELGLGPLHTQFDDRGNCYTSLFIESKVARWSLADLKKTGDIACHFNIGHLAVVQGDTAKPQGNYLVAMNKWAIDRFAKVGPLLPQNFQLIDISGDEMKRLYDMPIGLGEPHYAQIVAADKLSPWENYPVGTNPITHQPDPFAIKSEQEARVERKDDGVHVYMSFIRSHISPDVIKVKQGDTVHLHMTSLEQTYDATHGFAVGGHNINVSLEPGKTANVTFVANRSGVFPCYCSEFCSALHLEMTCYLLVEPKDPATAQR